MYRGLIFNKRLLSVLLSKQDDATPEPPAMSPALPRLCAPPLRLLSSMAASSSCSATCSSMSAVEFVDKEVESKNAVIFSKSYCP